MTPFPSLFFLIKKFIIFCVCESGHTHIRVYIWKLAGEVTPLCVLCGFSRLKAGHYIDGVWWRVPTDPSHQPSHKIWSMLVWLVRFARSPRVPLVPSAGITGAAEPRFLHGCWDQNPGLHACKQATEPSSQVSLP